jgi:hypothetical protein
VQLKAGQRLRSQVCTTELIVVRAPTTEIELSCGGKPVVDVADAVDATTTPAAGLDTGTQIGKRYSAPDESALEVLVTKPGAGTLSVGDTPLVFTATKPLPSSD